MLPGLATSNLLDRLRPEGMNGTSRTAVNDERRQADVGSAT
jgi:hypothetical protein